MTKVTPDIIEEMIEMATAGMGVVNIAEEFNVSESTVRRTLNKFQISPKRNHTLFDAIDTDQLIEDYLSWVSIDVITQKHKIERSQMYYLLKKLDIKPRTKDQDWIEAQQMRLDHAIQLYRQGERISYITAETGIHQPQLHEELARRNVPLRRPRPSSLPSDDEVRSRIQNVLSDN